jgi:hypothetical protein
LFFVFFLLLFVVFFAVLRGVLAILAGQRILDVAMVTSPLVVVGRGYHTASMLHNQTHTTG